MAKGNSEILKPLTQVDIVPIESPESINLGETTIAAPPFQTVSYPELIALRNPFGYWRGEETIGTTANDSGSGGNDGTYFGKFTLNQPGVIDEGVCPLYESTGLGDDAGITGPALGSLTFPLTFEAWINIPAYAGSKSIMISTHVHQDGYHGIRFNVGGDGAITILVGDGNIGFNSANYRLYKSPTLVIALNQRQHIVVVAASESSFIGYVNGVPYSMSLVDGTGGSVSWAMSGLLAIGWGNASANTPYVDGQYFDGYLDEVALYKSALSADDVLANYMAGIDDLP